MVQKIMLVCLSIGFFQLARSQSISPEVIANTGKYMSVGSNSIEFTLGELVASTLNTSGNIVTQGFHQTYSTTSSIDDNETKVTINVYPNPTADWLTITLNADKNLEFSAIIHDGLGRKVLDGYHSYQSQLQLNVSTLATGPYYITLMNVANNVPIRTIKIQKLSNQ